MRTITCGICGKKSKMCGKTIENKLAQVARNYSIVYKCRKCYAFLSIIRLNRQWRLRWNPSPPSDLTDGISIQK